jgi:hypothetical protein
MTSTSNPLGTLLSGLLTGLKDNVIIAVFPAIQTFITNTESLNPLTQPLEYIAQLDLLRSTIITKAPGLVLEEVQAVDAILSSHLQSILSAAQTAQAAAQAAQAAANVPGAAKAAAA